MINPVTNNGTKSNYINSRQEEIILKMLKDIIISPNDQDDITEILQEKFNELLQNHGGRLLINSSGEFFVRKTIVIPVRQESPRGISIVFEGVSSGLCNIRGQGLSASDPVFQWEPECELNIKSVNDDNDLQRIVKVFESEFESKKKACAILIISSASAPGKWLIAGFNDKGEFKREVLIDNSSDELSVELKKESINKCRIVKLSAAKIERTIRPSIVANFIWRNMTVRHNGGGTAIKHSSCAGRRFRNCILEKLFLLKTGSGSGSQPILDIEGVLHSTFRDIHFRGLGTGESAFRIRGSHAFLENIYVPQKNRSPSQLLDFSCGNSRLCHLRTEGGNSAIADYWIHDCQTVDIQNVHSEGDASQDIIRIENCDGITLTSVGVANQLKGEVKEPVGLHFVNSRYCTIIGSMLGARVDPGGYALIFDEQSNYNTVIATRIVKTNFANSAEQVLDKGTGNRWKIVDKNKDYNGTFFLMPD